MSSILSCPFKDSEIEREVTAFWQRCSLKSRSYLQICLQQRALTKLVNQDPVAEPNSCLSFPDSVSSGQSRHSAIGKQSRKEKACLH